MPSICAGCPCETRSDGPPLSETTAEELHPDIGGEARADRHTYEGLAKYSLSAWLGPARASYSIPVIVVILATAISNPKRKGLKHIELVTPTQA
jgi:hypothetical protein